MPDNLTVLLNGRYAPPPASYTQTVNTKLESNAAIARLESDALNLAPTEIFTYTILANIWAQVGTCCGSLRHIIWSEHWALPLRIALLMYSIVHRRAWAHLVLEDTK